MRSLIYIATPLLFGYVFLVPTFLVYRKLKIKSLQLTWSMRIAAGQAVLATASVAFTYHRSISAQACLTAILGSMASYFVVALDALNLLWWLVRGVGANGARWLPLPLLFVLLRLMSHAAFTGSLMWCSMLCTV